MDQAAGKRTPSPRRFHPPGRDQGGERAASGTDGLPPRGAVDRRPVQERGSSTRRWSEPRSNHLPQPPGRLPLPRRAEGEQKGRRGRAESGLLNPFLYKEETKDTIAVTFPLSMPGSTPECPLGTRREHFPIRECLRIELLISSIRKSLLECSAANAAQRDTNPGEYTVTEEDVIKAYEEMLGSRSH